MLSLGPPVASGRWAIGAVVTLALVYSVAIRAPDAAKPQNAPAWLTADLVAGTGGLVLGPATVVALASAGQLLDERKAAATDQGDGPCGFRRWFWQVKVMGLACLALSDEVTDVLSLITFYRNGAWPFFKASLTILIVSSLLGGFFLPKRPFFLLLFHFSTEIF